MAEGFVACALAFIGFASSAVLRDPVSVATRIWLAYPLGAAAWVASATVLLVLRIPLVPVVLVGVLVALAAFVFIVKDVRAPRSGWSSAVPLVVAVVLPGSIAALCAIGNLSVMTNDTFWILRQARTLVSAGGVWGPPEYLLLRSFPIAVALLQVPAEFVGRDYLASQPTVLAVTGIGALIALAVEGVRSVGAKNTDRWSVFIAGTLFLATTFLVVFQAFYIRGNLEAGVYIALAITSVWLGAVTGRAAWALPAGLSLVAAILFRVESPLFLLPFLVIAVATTAVPERIRVTVMGAYISVVVGWYGLVVLTEGQGNILDGVSIAVILLTAPGLLLVHALARTAGRVGRFVRDRAAALTVGALVLAAAGVTLWRPAWMAEAFANIGRNAFEPAQGLWGVTWLVLVPLFLFAVRYRRLPFSDLFTVWVGGYFLLLYISAAFFKVPHKLGWLSSANRMLTGVLIATWIFVLMHFTVAGAEDDAVDRAAST